MRRSSPIVSAAVPFFLFVAAALLFSINLDRLPNPDELYQIQAAERLLGTGEPRIADGLYTRAYAQTWLIAQSLILAGNTLPAARLSSLLAMAALIALLFVWLRPTAGALAAWITAVGFALSPFAVQTAQFARIYGLQSLGFFVTCFCIYLALGRPADQAEGAGWRWLMAPSRLLFFVLAGLSLAFAVQLQPTTLFGFLGLVLWAAAALALPWLRDNTVPTKRKLLVAGLCVLAGCVVLTTAWQLGALGRLWHIYRDVPLFNEGNKDEFWFYHAWYSLLYPTLWPFTGILALAALTAAPRPASLALCVYATGFLLNSFGAQKSLRYIAYAQPFLFALWGIGLAAVWDQLRRFMAGLGRQLAPILPLPFARAMAAILVGLAVLFLVVANPATIRTATYLADVQVPGEQPDPDWPAAKPTLEPLVARVPIVVTTEELGTLYFLGRFDVRFSPSKLREFDGVEFAADPRTGRAVISTPEALRLILQCFPEGLLVLPARHWNREHILGQTVRQLILNSTQPVPLPGRTHILAYTWQQSAGAARPAECSTIPPMPGPAARVRGH